MGHVWGFWDCNYCSAKHIRGDKKVCPNCGHPVDKNMHFYLDKDTLEDVAPEKENDDANWICSFCDSQNTAADEYCRGCGSSRSDSEYNYFHREEDAAKESAPAYTPPSYGSAQSRNKKMTIPGIALLCLLIAIPILLFRSVTVSSTVSDVAWQYTVYTEKYQECYEDAWSLPSGSRLDHQASEIHHYDQILDHYETRSRQVPHTVSDGFDTEYRDLGNGQFESYQVERFRTEYETEYYDGPVYRNEPVYETKYYYYIDRWLPDQSLVTSAHDHDPYWSADMPPASVADPSYGDLRCSGTAEEYHIFLSNGDSQTLTKEQWDTTFPGDEITYETTWIRSRKLNK